MNSETKVILSVNGKEFQLTNFEYKISREIDLKGMPSSRPRVGLMHFTKRSDKSFFFVNLLFNYDKQIDGNILFYENLNTNYYKRIDFEKAYVVDYFEYIQNDKKEGIKLLESFIISPEVIKIDGIALDNNWPYI
jgi:hypothetical protein